MRKELIETPDYILAVSDEEIKVGDWIFCKEDSEIYKCYGRMCGLILTQENSPLGVNPYFCVKITAYQPKGNALELDLPLLPEMVVEDDVERLAKEYSENKSSSDVFKEQHKVDFIAGYKSATKVYSEDDMKEAFNAGTHWKEKWKTVTDDNINIPDVNKFIQSLKQAKNKLT